MREILSDYQKQKNTSIRKIVKGIQELRNQGYTIEKELTETMIGTEVNHIYIRDRLKSQRIVEQKYLFSLDK